MKEITKLFYELGQLKRVKRAGWWMAKIDEPESDAEHGLRTVMIGRILAQLENVDYHKVADMLLFHDLHECRINDLHKVGRRYINHDNAKKAAFKEAISRLPKDMADHFYNLFLEFEDKDTPEAIVAKDADLLECAIQAKEYVEIGYKDAQNWIDNVTKRLKTKSAKKILDLVKRTDSNEWWKGLKNIKDKGGAINNF